MVIEARRYLDKERGLLDRSIFADEEVYQQELERIFTRAWLWIGHDSLVPNPNDFFTTYMGEDPVILTRDAKGQLHAMLNMCRHRGNRVVRADDGNAKNFMCTYHGWTYSSDGGKLVSVPGLQEAYYGELDVERLGLIEVAQLDTYAGHIFATWDPGAPSLEDYLGDMRWYTDTWFNRRESGLELVGPYKWVIPTNWKMPADNFAGDNYHVNITHRSATIAQAKVRGQTAGAAAGGAQAQAFNQGTYGVGVNGHATSGRFVEVGQQAPQISSGSVLRQYRQEIQAEMEERLGPTQVRFSPIVGTIFPNFSFLLAADTVRVWHPRGPLSTEVWSFVAVDKDAPEEIKRTTRLDSISRFGTSGMFEQDDMDNWNACVAASKSLMARRVPQHMGMGLGHEIKHAVMPGTVEPGSSNEVVQRAFYARWEEFMTTTSWKELPIEPRSANYEGTATFKG